MNLAADGDWTVKVHTYNKEGNRVTTNSIRICRDTVAPVVRKFEMETTSSTTASVKVTNDGFGVSEQRTGGGYTYYFEGNNQNTNTQPTYNYSGLNKTYDLDIALKVQTLDKAGNKSESYITKKILHLTHRGQVGEYVDFDAGVWTETTANPSTHLAVGGQRSGTLVSTGLEGLNGWVITAIDDNSVTISTIGHPLNAYYGPTSGTLSQGINPAWMPSSDCNKLMIDGNSECYQGTKMSLNRTESVLSYKYVSGVSAYSCSNCGFKQNFSSISRGYEAVGWSYGVQTYPVTEKTITNRSSDESVGIGW